ncbi:hypothetical protein [Marimonas arenosa]|uniref:Uncharacterized protein n=1 Tax=Marimonas arenosa TaxID=1795305 RepID=A0AAE3WFP7_9RHOB|nr:hypothetical protein [Marimonas arenosa]MDQ2091887.1 hypothetical protein [Marimonas arenosa]
MSNADLSADASAKSVSRHDTIDLDRLDQAQRTALGDTLYVLHQKIFRGPDKAHFFNHVFSPDAERNMLRLYLDETGAPVGYCAVHRFRRHLADQACLVIRAEAGLDPDFRGRSSTYWFGMIRALRTKLRHPFTPLYYLGTLVHTSSYHLFCKYFPLVYPSAGRPMPEQMRALALNLIESFDSPAVDPADPLVRDVGWITIETPQETRLSRQNHRPDIAYFLERNPGFARGHGLVVLVPLSWSNLFAAIGRRLREVIGLKLTRRPERL